MVFKLGCGVSARLLTLVSIGLVLGACQSTNSTLDVSGADEKKEFERISFEELRGYCPQVQLREGTAFFTTYDGEENKDNVRYQASITDVSRQCRYDGGQLTMTVAVAGRVLLGPKGSSGTLTLPVRVAALKGDSVIYSEIRPYAVEVNTAGATQFIYTDSNVAISQPDARNILIFAGFDEGPKKTARTN